MVCVWSSLSRRLFSTVDTSMRKFLNVAEKNDAAKTISGHLSNGTSNRRDGLSVYNKIYEYEYQFQGQPTRMVMTSVSGHLLTHAFSPVYKNWKGCDPIALFDAPVHKMCPDDFVKIKQTLEREIRSCIGLIIWTDCDREGENIGFEVIDVCRAVKPNLRVFRAKFSEMTKPAIVRAMATLGQPDERQSAAVDVRSELDLRIGAAFTRFQTLRLQSMFPTNIESLVSYGSCQIPTLGFVVQRYKEADSFVPQTFWRLKVTHTVEDLTVEFNWARHRLFDRDCCQALLMQCQANPQANVVSVTNKPKSKWRPIALDTVELEKLGSRKLRLTAKETMTIAEKLYSQGFISYPRTETNQFSNEVNLVALAEQHTVSPAWGAFASKVLQWQPSPRNGKKSDQAHPPIHPTKFTDSLSGNERKVYELVVRHFLACISRDAVGSETVVQINIAGEEFSATGLVIRERNYLEVYPYENWTAKEILNYEEGTHFEPTAITMPEGTTTAPALLTEADLIALMDKHGIGTDATHAEHINMIKNRGYIGVVDRGYLVPGLLGMGLVEGYDSMNLPLAQPQLRAELEVDLKRVCEGVKSPAEVLREQIEKYRDVYKIITERVLALDRALGARFNTEPQHGGGGAVAAGANGDGFALEFPKEVLKCPKCDTFQMVLKKKKDAESYFISCLGFPDCKNAIWFGNELRSISVTDDTCTICRKAKVLEFKFRNISIMSMLNSDSLTYNACIMCDAKLRDTLNIRPMVTNSIASAQNPPANTVQSRSNINTVATTINNNHNNHRNNDYNVTRPTRDPNTWGTRGQPIDQPSNKRRNPDPSAETTDNVRCTKCNEEARVCVVRKEGPNKGRSFYTCNTNCNFFKWADHLPNNQRPLQAANRDLTANNMSWGTGGLMVQPSGSRSTNGNNSNSINESTNRPTARRKCGICKQEGHTRRSCPMANVN